MFAQHSTFGITLEVDDKFLDHAYRPAELANGSAESGASSEDVSGAAKSTAAVKERAEARNVAEAKTKAKVKAMAMAQAKAKARAKAEAEAEAKALKTEERRRLRDEAVKAAEALKTAAAAKAKAVKADKIRLQRNVRGQRRKNRRRKRQREAAKATKAAAARRASIVEALPAARHELEVRRVLAAVARGDWPTALGLEPGTLVDARGVRRAYKAQCLAVHPDKNHAPEAGAAFAALRRALEEELMRAHARATTAFDHATGAADAANAANATAEVCTPPPLPLTDRSAAVSVAAPAADALAVPPEQPRLPPSAPTASSEAATKAASATGEKTWAEVARPLVQARLCHARPLHTCCPHSTFSPHPLFRRCKCC